MKRNGQITLYVLASLLLLLLILFLLIFRHETFVDVDTAFVAPVTATVTNCLGISFEQLLRQVGANGGYLDTSHLHHDARPEKSDTVQFPPQDVPYWSHVESCSSSSLGCEASEQPPLCKQGSSCPVASNGDDSVQEQLEAALPGAVDACLNNFKGLEQLYTIEKLGEPTAEVLFTDDKVFATLHQRLRVTDIANGNSAVVEEFSTDADVTVVTLYALANKIADAERRTRFLEHLTLHLIAIYSGVDQELPPMRAVTLLGQKRYWSTTNVRLLLQEEVLPWTDFIQVVNAPAGFAPIWPSTAKMASLSEEEQAMYAGIFSYLYLKLDNETIPDVKVKFFYPYTTPELTINGGQELLKPRSIGSGGLLEKLTGVFLNDYRFNYDLTYPVIVTISDPEAFGGKGYDWSFALEANIYKNQPLNRSAAAQHFFLIDERVDFTSPQQLVRNTIEVQANDKRSGAPLEGVRVSYRCGDESFVGETNSTGSLKTRLPYCRFGGVLLYNKEGYLGSGVEYDNYEERIVKRIPVTLWPLQNITVNVRKRTSEQVAALLSEELTADRLRNKSSELGKNDLVIVNFERVKESPYDEETPLVGFFTLSLENQSVVLEEKEAEVKRLVADGVLSDADAAAYRASFSAAAKKRVASQPSVLLRLAPGRYTLEAFLIHTKPITIPEETREFCMVGGGSTCIKRDLFTMNETNLSMWILGGAALNESSPLLLGENILYAHENMTLYMVLDKLPASWEDLEHLQTLEEYLKDKRLLQLPTYD